MSALFSLHLRRRLISGLLLTAICCSASANTLGKGAKFDFLTVGKKTFHEVVVREVTVRSIAIMSAEGLASIPLKDLSPELQSQFGYNPQAEAAADEKMVAKRAEWESRQQSLAHENALLRGESEETKFARIQKSFSQGPVVQPEVDLRAKFRELALGVKDQGRRPSCAIFAVVSALEFQNAELTGKPEKLSEEYLSWSTRMVTHAAALASAQNTTAEVSPDDKDDGYSLGQVMAALTSFGIVPQSAMPNTFGISLGAIPRPSEDLVRAAQNYCRVIVHPVPGPTPALQLGNFVQILNEGVPVVIGLRFPHARTMRTGYISDQSAMENYRHAVTLVGYTSSTGQIEDAVFLFKNSYGLMWGEAGYGRVTYRYLNDNLLDAIYLEVKKPNP